MHHHFIREKVRSAGHNPPCACLLSCCATTFFDIPIGRVLSGRLHISNSVTFVLLDYELAQPRHWFSSGPAAGPFVAACGAHH